MKLKTKKELLAGLVDFLVSKGLRADYAKYYAGTLKRYRKSEIIATITSFKRGRLTTR